MALKFLIVIAAAAPWSMAAGRPASFQNSVQPLIQKNCSGCHNAKLPSGNLNLTGFLDPASLVSNREGWERIVAKLRAGEMPPKGIPRPPVDQLAALLTYVQSEFDRADSLAKPDPGRVTARRLNRAEYANTIRDLLGVHFVAQEEFPVDDSGYGFDNISDVLTVSPALLEKYLFAAERIASRAVGADPLPKPGVFSEKNRMLRSASIGQCKDHVEYDAEYILRATLSGHRGATDKPVTVVLSVDGKPIQTSTVDVKISDVNRQGGATQRNNVEGRVFLTEGPHTFRVEIVNDDALKDIPKDVRLNPNRNIFPETMELAGPFVPPRNNAPRRDFLLCDPAAGRSCIEKIMTALGRRAYRRPVTTAGVAQLVSVSDKARDAGYTPGQCLQFAIEAMLVSPEFLFRIEHDPKPGAVGRISDIELASRLSYFLWSSMPDDELLKLGEANRLHEPAVLDSQVKRMISDPKSSALAENFAGQWLEIRSLDAVKPDKVKFPEWGPELKEAMRTETTMFFEAVMRENRPVSEFIDGKYTFLNESLAKHYGIDGINGPEFRHVELTTDQRSGVLTQASVLTVSSYPSRTSPVLRGKYLLENVLGAPPPPPPADVPPLDEASAGTSKSLRQTMEQHRSNAVCASCHSRMDVLGFGLENYNAVGQWRAQDGKFPVDASGTFPNGKSFNTPAEMKALLLGNLPDFTRCLTEKMLTYALGRGVEKYDRLAVQQIVRQTSANDYRFQSLILGIARSVPFQMRRGEVKQEMASR